MNEPDQSLQYRALNKTAIVALLLALLGATSLVIPQMLFCSIAAICVAILALFRIRNSDLENAGGGLAVFALFLSFFCISNITTHYVVHSRRLLREARGHAEAFFDLLAQNELQKAHQLMLPEEERQRQGADLDLFYQTTKSNDPMADQSPQEKLRATFESPSMKKLLEYLKEGKRPTFLRPLGIVYEANRQLVSLEYRMDRADDLFMVAFRRQENEENGETTWQFWRTTMRNET